MQTVSMGMDGKWSFSGFVVSFPNEIAHDDPDFYLSLDCSKGAHPKCRVEGKRAVEWPYRRFSFSYRTFSHGVTTTIFVPQSNETAAMLVSQTNPLGVELFFVLATWEIWPWTNAVSSCDIRASGERRYFGYGARKCSFPATCVGIFRFQTFTAVQRW